MKNRKIVLSVAMTVLAAALSFAETLEVKINPEKTYQTVDNFAAADAWSGNFVGQYFDEAQKGQVAKWLFSQKIGADGNPEGIGLSMWRINVGGGSLERDGADIMPFQRRAESFLTKDGKGYDWGKCAGQQYFMRKAREYGCDKFLLFSNTPPVQWTRNGKGYAENTKDFSSNLKPDCYGKFADFLADVARHFQDEGFNIAYISPINEPQWKWDINAQEGSPWHTSEIFKVFAELDRAMTERKLDNTKMLFGEVADIQAIYKAHKWKHFEANKNELERPNNLLKNFFDKNGKWYVGNLKHQPMMVGGHSYSTHKTNEIIKSRRLSLGAACEKYGVEYQQTEWCLLPHFNSQNHEGFTPDWKSDNRADIQVALLLGKLVYADFVYAGATAWGYWKGMEIKGDHALTGVYPADGDIRKGGVVRANKLLWALGNYSLFVRPGYKRIELAGAENLDDFAGMAFKSPDGGRIVAVFVNSSFGVGEASLLLPEAYANRVSKISAFRTDANMDMGNLYQKDAKHIVLAPRSITTVVLDFN